MSKKILFLVFLLSVVSCGVCKKAPQIVIRDSIRVEYRDRIIHDSVAYEVPVEIERVITRDTASHLENRLAVSDAIVSNGFLSHSLETKAQTIYVPYEVNVTDTLVIEKSGEIITETVYVEKQLNWWQKFRMKGFWWMFAAVAGCLVYIFRKPLLALIRTIL